MKKQTAIEFLIEEIECRGIITKQLRIAFQQAKEMEKEQIEDAYKEGRSSGQANWGFGNDTTSEEYFKETYKK